MTEPGLPQDWVGQEAQALRWGSWRFFRVIDPKQEESVSEDNIPVRDGVGMPGEEGLRAFITELRPLEGGDVPPPETLAAQVGHFLIRGSSRESCYVRVVTDGDGAPRTEVAGETWIHRARFRRDGYEESVTVRLTAPDAVTVEFA